MGKRRTILNAQRPMHCNGKVIYKNKKLADGAAARARKRSGIQTIDSYKCLTKSHFHIGDQQKYQDSRKRALADRRDPASAGISKVDGNSLSPVDDGTKAPVRHLGSVTGSLWSTNGTPKGTVS